MLTEEAKAKRREYSTNYKKKNAERLKAYKKEWSRRNPEKLKQYQENYWNKKGMEDNQ